MTNLCNSQNDLLEHVLRVETQLIYFYLKEISFIRYFFFYKFI